jgi:hypothetical protein
MTQKTTFELEESFQLWDVEANSAVGGYRTELEAMDIVRSALRQFGADDVLSLALFRVNEKCELTLLADGQTLLDRVQHRGPIRSTPK